jgi:hypothetical protein
VVDAAGGLYTSISGHGPKLPASSLTGCHVYANFVVGVPGPGVAPVPGLPARPGPAPL